MFDLAWSEIALIGVVALVVIGPKHLPEAIRGVARGIAKLRRMASEFQGQADELVREANLDEVRQSINEIRRFNVRDEFTKAVDKDGSIRKTFTEDPLRTDYGASTMPQPASEPTPEATEGTTLPAGSAAPAEKGAPAFVPPAFVPPSAAAPTAQTAGAALAGTQNPDPAPIQKT